ncbi:MAG: 4-diphosphocytidyl-2-C-methyl-D-erythritol kinase [Verrucomicrobia bacterium ADurb.Bin474]|nr:MAG: 4-diphosphocytidyl-2-C-methyl-D-erythritol kinase [Verrucomicrobia bacterium ADurb.Bin474]
MKSGIESSPSRWRDFIHNDLYPPVAQKYLAIPTLIRILKHTHGLAAYMSGSGSGCFAIPTSDHEISAIRESVTEAWGLNAFLLETTFV